MAARHRLLLALRAATLVVAAAALGGCGDKLPVYPPVAPEDGEVRLAAAPLCDGDAHFYSCELDGKRINFFARTDAEGRLLTHFDACYNCYKYRLGYVQEGREVICRACRIAYDLDESEWDWVGPCVPVTLKSRLDGDDLVITRKKLESGARLF